MQVPDSPTKTTHVHGEAFMHMIYESDDGRERITVWNTRDGVTPFGIGSVTDKDLYHKYWKSDVYDPNYKPKEGDFVFIDSSQVREQYIPKAERYVEKHWDAAEFPMKRLTKNGWAEDGEQGWTKEEAIEHWVQEWTKVGSPAIAIVQKDGSYKLTDF